MLQRMNFLSGIASNFTSVDEVEAALENVAIVAKQVNEQYPVALLHYIICDAKRSIVVEYMADGMHVHHNDVDVLANQPTYDWHHEHLRSYLNLSSEFKPQVKWGNGRVRSLWEWRESGRHARVELFA